MKKLKLSSKLYLGFGVMIVLALAIGFVGWNGFSDLPRLIENADSANRVIKILEKGRIAEKNFILRHDYKYHDVKKKEVIKINKEREKLLKGLHSEEGKSMVRAIWGHVEGWSVAFDETIALVRQKDAAEEAMVKSARDVLTEAEKMRQDQKKKLFNELRNNAKAAAIRDRITKADDANRFIKDIFQTRSHEKNYIIKKDNKYIKGVEKDLEVMRKLAASLKMRFKDARNDKEVDNVLHALMTYEINFNKFVQLTNKQNELTTHMVEAAHGAEKKADELRQRQKVRMNSAMSNAITVMVVFVVCSFIVGLLLAIFLTKAITGPIMRLASSLNDSATQVASASEQVSSASQQLSEAASEQASSIEETSASLEEMTGMVDNNVGNAENSSKLSGKVKDFSDKGNSSMKQMSESMEEILDSNEKIQELVKVIGEIGEKTAVMDEIVFQTKLLSFNASVEAERAGEHGRGFAVVAQEVGNLAQMSGTAAQEISSIVKESIKNAETITVENKKKVESGNVQVKEVAEILGNVAENSQSVLQSADQILGASKDQSSGINQINTAMGQLDRATQENASTAEETASSSEELSAQAEVLNQLVSELTELVTGKREENLVMNASKKRGKVIDFRKDKKTVSKQPIKEVVGSDVSAHPEDKKDEAWEQL